MVWRFNLIFASFLVSTLLGLCNGSIIGVCYGQNGDNLPTPDKVVELVKQQNIKNVRIYDSNIQVIKAFANTGVELMIGVPNSDLYAFSQVQSNVDTWLKNHVLPYYPSTMITYITVGNEVASDPNISAIVVPAMRNVLTSLKQAGLHQKIKVSSTHSTDILTHSFPPSAAVFRSDHVHFLKPVLEFLDENQSPFMVDMYPYLSYAENFGLVSIDYALFLHSSRDEVIDSTTGLGYTNIFDTYVDAFYSAITALNFTSIKVMVTETGWPSSGSPNEKDASIDNAQTYNTNLIHHISNNQGTPANPDVELDTYIFSLFDENKNPGDESKKHWGLFYPNGTSVYNLDFKMARATNISVPKMASGGNVTNTTGPTWCIASSTAPNKAAMQNDLNWVCGPSGNVNCTAIQPTHPCFEPDTLVSHASYAFNSYYQQNGAADVACSFGGAGVKVAKDPSYGKCLYLTAGSKNTSAHTNVSPTVSIAISVQKRALFLAWIPASLLIDLLVSFL